MIAAVVITVFGVISSTNVVSSYFSDAKCSLHQYACDFLTSLGFHPFMLDSKYFIWYSLIPISAIAGFVYYFIRHIGKELAIFLSIIIAFSTIPSGVLVAFDAVLLSILGQYAFVGGVFLVALWIGEGIARGWEGGVIKRELAALESLNKRERELLEEESKIIEKITKEKQRISGVALMEYNKRLNSIKAELAKIREKRSILAEQGIA